MEKLSKMNNAPKGRDYWIFFCTENDNYTQYQNLQWPPLLDQTQDLQGFYICGHEYKSTEQ